MSCNTSLAITLIGLMCVSCLLTGIIIGLAIQIGLVIQCGLVIQ